MTDCLRMEIAVIEDKIASLQLDITLEISPEELRLLHRISRLPQPIAIAYQLYDRMAEAIGFTGDELIGEAAERCWIGSVGC